MFCQMDRDMTIQRMYSRRQFLQAAVSVGLSGPFLRYSWAIEKPVQDTTRFVFFSDVHARTEWGTPEALDMAVRAIRTISPDAVLGGGDYITDGFDASIGSVDERWAVYAKMHQALPVPLLCAVGNHDLVAVKPKGGGRAAENPRSQFLELTGESSTWFSRDMKGIHVVVLDSIDETFTERPYRGYISNEQIKWLKNDLSFVDEHCPVVLVSHIPLKSKRIEEGDYGEIRDRLVQNSDEVLDCFQHHTLTAVLQGHLHIEECFQDQGVTFITGGAICGKWWRGSWQGTPEGFGLLEFNGNNVQWEYQAYGWIARRPAHL